MPIIECCRSILNEHGTLSRILTGVGNLGGLGTKVHQRGPGVELRWKSGAKPPEAYDKL